MKLNEHLTQTGRTTKLLHRAYELALTGRHVFVMCSTHVHVKHVEEMLVRLHGGLSGVSVITLPRDFDWETMRPKNVAHSWDTIYLPDHVVAEQEILRLQAKIAHFQLLQMQIYPMTL